MEGLDGDGDRRVVEATCRRVILRTADAIGPVILRTVDAVGPKDLAVMEDGPHGDPSRVPARNHALRMTWMDRVPVILRTVDAIGPKDPAVAEDRPYGDPSRVTGKNHALRMT